jgi:UDP-N-acetylglucosamine 4,6-dehydratase/UDP-glucose 4-epimerase
MINFFKNKKVLITGGTGSLGRALIKKLKKFQCEIIIYSRDEGKQSLYFGKDKDIIRIIGDIRDFEKLNYALSIYKPNYVIHTAALKRIDDVEYYPDEAVKTNILGSINVTNACLLNKIDKCILISTDKACQPINVYGATKFIAERMFLNQDYYSSKAGHSTIFTSVRYGNVIASRGSFIPIWIDALENNEPIKVTSLDCTRFLFTLEDSVNTVLNSLMWGVGGEVFVPKLNSFTMQNVMNSIEFITKKPLKYIEIGMRPGEKFHEDMLANSELPFTYTIPFDEEAKSFYCEELLCILPQYTQKSYAFKKYTGIELNSQLLLNTDQKFLNELIIRGLKDAE